jgi:hypothetical protein
LTEPAYHQALINDHGPWARSVRRRRVMLPLLRPLAEQHHSSQSLSRHTCPGRT